MKYLVKFSKPFLLNVGGENEDYYKTIYGFLGGDYDSDPELIENEKQNDRNYASYLCAMSEWSRGAKTFSLSSTNHWIDRKGVTHGWDRWTDIVGEKSRKKLGVEYDTYLIELDESNDACCCCGIIGGLVTCEALMDNLVENAEPLELIERKKNVFLFNRPIWLPKNCFRGCDEPEHLLIYGVVTEKSVDDELQDAVKYYQGYLAMAEEFHLCGTTPSGYVALDMEGNTYWYQEGTAYSPKEEVIKDECLLCRRKSRLEISRVILEVPIVDLRGGLDGEFIVSQELYESLLDRDC